jgi:hypothetical protein
MTNKIDFPLYKIYKVDASKRIGHHNAAVIGTGKK